MCPVYIYCMVKRQADFCLVQATCTVLRSTVLALMWCNLTIGRPSGSRHTSTPVPILLKGVDRVQLWKQPCVAAYWAFLNILFICHHACRGVGNCARANECAFQPQPPNFIPRFKWCLEPSRTHINTSCMELRHPTAEEHLVSARMGLYSCRYSALLLNNRT